MSDAVSLSDVTLTAETLAVALAKDRAAVECLRREPGGPHYWEVRIDGHLWRSVRATANADWIATEIPAALVLDLRPGQRNPPECLRLPFRSNDRAMRTLAKAVIVNAFRQAEIERAACDR